MARHTLWQPVPGPIAATARVSAITLWPDPSRSGGGRLLKGVLSRLGPAFRERQRAGAERTALARQRPGLAGGLDAVAGKRAPERRDQQRADPVFASVLAGAGVDQQRLADIVPGQADRLVMRDQAFGPVIARVPAFENSASTTGIDVSAVSAFSIPCTVPCSQRAIAILSE